MRAVMGARARWRSALFFVVPVVAGLFSGCGSKPVAEVNGQTLSEKDFSQRCESALNVSNQATVGIQVLTNWITSEIQAQEAKRLKVYPSEKELDARIEAIRKRLEFNGEPLEKSLQMRGQSLAAFRQGILDQLVTEKVMANGITVTDEEMKKEFDSQAGNFGKPELVKISQITVDSEATAKQAHSELAGNAQFGVVASTHSKDIFAQQQGRVQGEWPKQIQPGLPISQEAINAAFKLQPGQFSDPIKVGAQWIIVKLEDKTPAKKPQFEEVRELVRAELIRRKVERSGNGQKAQQALIQAMLDADVKINRPEYEMVATQLKEIAKQGAPPPGAGAGMPGGEGLPPAPPGQ